MLAADLRKALGLRQDADGVWRCECGSALEADDLACSACKVKADRERAEAASVEAVARWRRSIEACATFPALPAWPFARLDNAAFTRKVVHKPFLLAAERYAFHQGPLFLSGPTGSFKSTLTVALIHRIAAAEVARVLAEPPGTPPSRLLKRLQRLAWISGFDLAKARRQTGLGVGEAEVVARAFAAPFLVLDELGFEPMADGIVFELADARYRNGLPSIITTGLTPRQFAERYGDAVFRRFAELGLVVSAWPEEKSGRG